MYENILCELKYCCGRVSYHVSYYYMKEFREPSSVPWLLFEIFLIFYMKSNTKISGDDLYTVPAGGGIHF